MKTALTLRAALSELIPGALYLLPPEETHRGLEEAVQVSHPVRDVAEDTLSAPRSNDPSDELGEPRELEELFEFGPEVADALPALGETEAERIRQALLAKGVDALGWYVPFHAIGVQWGIYIPTSSLAYVARDVFSNLPVDAATRIKLAFRAIHQHELFHFATEYAVAQLELLVAQPLHVHRSELKDPSLGYITDEEQAANAWMLRSLWSAKHGLRTPGRAKALRRFVSRQPAGYRNAGEIIGTDRFRGASHSLLAEYLYLRYDARGADRVNLDWLLPITPRIDWRQCPVHVIHDTKRLPFAPGAFDLFAHVREIVVTKAFEAELKKLSPSLQGAWEKTRRMLSVTTAVKGLDFKLWERGPSGRVYSVRISQSCRAHLRYDERGNWYAEEIGPHKAMGHG